MYEYRAHIARIIDGDTVDMLVDFGFRISQTMRLRLLGVDCPELGTAEGETAKTYAINWLMGRKLRIRTHKDKADSFGRYLAEIEDEETGESLNRELVLNGHATVRLK